jgi:hypothetical protein
MRVISVAGRALREKHQTTVADVERVLNLYHVQGLEKDVEECHPSQCAQGVALRASSARDPWVVRLRIHPFYRRVEVLPHPIGRGQAVGGHSPQVG